jgi:hypothetical protein
MAVAFLSSLRGAQSALRNADWNIDTTNRADTLSSRSLCAKRARWFFNISAGLKNGSVITGQVKALDSLRDMAARIIASGDGTSIVIFRFPGGVGRLLKNDRALSSDRKRGLAVLHV